MKIKNKMIYAMTISIIILWEIIIGNVFSTDETDSTNIRILYEYNNDENYVIAKIISEEELEDTKPTWKLSENKKEYTKIYRENMNYTTQVKDVTGKVTNIEVNIKDVKKLEVGIEYEYNEDSNEVLAIMRSNVRLKDTKPTWKLSEDKKTYTKLYNTNTQYNTRVESINGEVIDTEINVKGVKKLAINIEYEYMKETNEVLAIMKSNIKLKDTKPTWKLSDDEKTYTKLYKANVQYSTKVESINGEVIDIKVRITDIDDEGPQITLEYKYNLNNTITIYMKSNEELKDTKPTWKLNENKMVYEKEYESTERNYNTTVQDKYGNISNVNIFFKKKNEDVKLGQTNLKIGYIYTKNDEVIVQLLSDKEFKDTKPTWTLSEDKKTYTKIYHNDEDYMTSIKFLNGDSGNIRIIIDYFFKITYEKNIYGYSGAAIQGKSGGTNLEYFRYGSGPNVMFLTFCVHGYEDSWDRDGGVLVDIANNLYNRLLTEQDKNIAKKWTIYIFPEVNPDGRRLGNSNYGPGRRTLYSKIGKGIDINRSWQTGSTYKRYTDSRNYNGTAGFQAYEAEYLRDFLLSRKSKSGKTILVDLHGWENQLIGDAEVCQYYKKQYTSCRTSGYGRYGTQYLITWARQNLGAKVSLVELPVARNYEQVNNMKLSDKYINATLEMLRNEI